MATVEVELLNTLAYLLWCLFFIEAPPSTSQDEKTRLQVRCREKDSVFLSLYLQASPSPSILSSFKQLLLPPSPPDLGALGQLVQD